MCRNKETKAKKRKNNPGVNNTKKPVVKDDKSDLVKNDIKQKNEEYLKKLICVEIATTCLAEEDSLFVSNDDKEKFIIGLFSDERKWWIFPRNKIFAYWRCKRALKKDFDNSFLLGYTFQRYLDKWSVSKKLKNIGKIGIKEKTSFESKPYKIPEYKLIYSKYLKSLYSYPYYIEKDNIENIVKSYSINKDVDPEVQSDLFTIVQPFLYDVARLKEKQIHGKSAKESVKWSADALKMKYYRERFNSICEKAYGSESPDFKDCIIFFKGLEQELIDVNDKANVYLHKKNSISAGLITMSFFIAIINALTVAGNSNIVDNEYVSKMLLLILPLGAAILSSIQALIQALNKDVKPTETWLRHRINYANIIREIECFCYGIGAYKDVSKVDAAPEALRGAFSIFQNSIAELRKKDYDQFFANMGVGIINNVVPTSKKDEVNNTNPNWLPGTDKIESDAKQEKMDNDNT